MRKYQISLFMSALLIYVSAGLPLFATCNGLQLMLIRHGTGTHNLKNIRNSEPGRNPANLTQKGVEEVKRMMSIAPTRKEKYISYTLNDLNLTNTIAIFVSPLERTIQTGSLIAAAIKGDSKFKNIKDKGGTAANDHELSKNKWKKLSKIVKQEDSSLRLEPRIIEKQFGACEGTQALDRKDPNDCYNNEANLKTVETQEEIHVRTNKFLDSIYKDYCFEIASFDNQNKPHFIAIVTHDSVVKSIAKHLGIIELNSKEELHTANYYQIGNLEQRFNNLNNKHAELVKNYSK